MISERSETVFWSGRDAGGADDAKDVRLWPSQDGSGAGNSRSPRAAPIPFARPPVSGNLFALSDILFIELTKFWRVANACGSPIANVARGHAVADGVDLGAVLELPHLLVDTEVATGAESQTEEWGRRKPRLREAAVAIFNDAAQFFGGLFDLRHGSAGVSTTKIS